MKSIFSRFAFGALALAAFTSYGQETAQLKKTTASQVASNTPVAAPTKNEYEPLKGKWERPDGGYILEIRGADAKGKLDAVYFNPSPIKVSQSHASLDGNDLKVFVELRDENYPGCTYKLTYDAKNDQLFGQYYQVAIQETYDVAFARVK